MKRSVTGELRLVLCSDAFKTNKAQHDELLCHLENLARGLGCLPHLKIRIVSY
jgi:hypothetical protein